MRMARATDAEEAPILGDVVRTTGGRSNHVGTVRFVGRTSFAEGVWVGLELDYAGGKNNGSVDGIRYDGGNTRVLVVYCDGGGVDGGGWRQG